MITASTRLVALLGHPVAHSRSPAMQNAAFAARGLDWAYVALDVGPAELEDAVRGLVALGFAGANVTIPHKRAVAELCDELDRAAARAASVNTLVVRDGRILGSSTDGAAVVDAVEPRGARALVLGGGGAALAVAAALSDAGAEVRLAGRRDPDWPPRDADATLLVNATPVVDGLLVEPRPGQTVVDLAYTRDGDDTALVAAARTAGCRVVDGLEILVRQGAASFERWTGIPAPIEVMRSVVRP
ncbi:MAG TPA: shikimate dehydrogenase [Gaiellaceae bacterium]|nr:shikimate dehydrogenase [Gaiellaceae bacterium]